MSIEDEDTTLSAGFQESRWYGPITAWLLGVVTVIFLSLLGGAIDSSTDLVNISGELITSVRLASIGLGTGFYIGSSFRHREAEKSWYLLGIFSVLVVLSIFTVDTVILGQYPAIVLMVAGGVLTVLAHATPLVVENEEYLKLLKYIAGYLSTGVVVLLVASKFIISAALHYWNWFTSQPLIQQGLILIVTLFISWIFAHAAIKLINLLIEEDKERSGF